MRLIRVTHSKHFSSSSTTPLVAAYANCVLSLVVVRVKMNRFERTGLLERERERDLLVWMAFYFLACLASVTSIFLAI